MVVSVASAVVGNEWSTKARRTAPSRAVSVPGVKGVV